MRDTTPQELMNRLDQCIAALGRGNTVLKTLGLQKAQTEKDYKVRQAQEILKLRAEGNPVTIIQDLVKGNEEVAEASYFTGIEAMNNLRLEIEIIRSKLTWLRVEFKNS